MCVLCPILLESLRDFSAETSLGAADKSVRRNRLRHLLLLVSLRKNVETTERAFRTARRAVA